MQKAYIPKKPLNSAVLFLVFNRLDTTKQVFASIRQAKPPRLYIASDGPRKNVSDEIKNVEQVRSYILENIDWQCEVKTLFRDKNLGCKYAVSSSIGWFFENEEQGIILEDDCLPSNSFFWFCDDLLEKYKDNLKIGQICGCNFQRGISRGDADYYFSVYGLIWGWASWRNRWENYDVELTNLGNSDFLNHTFDNQKTIRYWKEIFKSMKKKLIDTWDYQWTLQLFKQNQLNIIPNVNLVKNIGFGENATHTVYENEFSNIDNFEIDLSKHPQDISPDKEADNFLSKIMFNKKPIHIRLINKIRKLFL